MYSLRTVGQLAAYLPYSLGFHPHASVVVSGMIRAQLGMTARVDVPDPPDVRRLAGQVADAMAREGHDAAVVFGTTDGPDPAPLMQAVTTRLLRHGIRVSDQVLLDTLGNWRSRRCGCGRCPSGWTALPDLSASALVLEHVVRGDLPVTDREELAGGFDPPDCAEVSGVRERVARQAPPRPEEVGPAVRRLLGADAPLLDDLAVTGAALRRIEIRDGVLSWLVPSVWPARLLTDPVRRRLLPGLGDSPAAGPEELRSSAHETSDRLRAWAVRLPPELQPPVLTLLAGHVWSRGGGALGMIAVERALQIDPGYSLARLIGSALMQGLRPNWREEPSTM